MDPMAEPEVPDERRDRISTMDGPVKKLKIGLLLDSLHVDKYVHELALWMRGQEDIELSCLILQVRPDESLPARLLKLLLKGGPHVVAAKILFRITVGIEKLLLRRSDPHRDHYRTCDLSGLAVAVVEIRPIVSPSGHVYRFSEGDVAKVKALELDLLIRCGQGILRGEILATSRLGVLSFHHGDNRINRGGPAGFWECYYRWPRTGFIIQRLTEELDAGEVLVRGHFCTRHYYSLNQAHVYKKALAHLKRLLKQIASTGVLPQPERAPALYSNALFRTPNLAQCIAYGGKLLARTAVKAATRLLMLRERWGISVLPARWDEAVLWRSTAVPAPRGRFWADPFVWAHNGSTYCFVEDYVYQRGKAHISALEIKGTEVVDRGIALKEPFHLSFPYLFEYQGALYMCPETGESGQIRVYRCTDFPLKWELEGVLMEGVSAVDTMLFQKDGRWWMLTSIDESGAHDHCSELYLFSSDSPLSTRWAPHRLNPIKIDSCGGRNAGLIVEGEKILRLSQCQGFDRYGHSLQVNEIREVSDSRYVEEPVTRIDPSFRKGLLGTHHLSTDGRIMVVDHISRSFVF